jgi:hypothetical protein
LNDLSSRILFIPTSQLPYQSLVHSRNCVLDRWRVVSARIGTAPSGDQRISRQHLHLVEEFGRWVLVDHSRNGVYDNDELVRGNRRELQHGDHITIGDSVELVFDDPNTTSAVE